MPPVRQDDDLTPTPATRFVPYDPRRRVPRQEDKPHRDYTPAAAMKAVKKITKGVVQRGYPTRPPRLPPMPKNVARTPRELRI